MAGRSQVTVTAVRYGSVGGTGWKGARKLEQRGIYLRQQHEEAASKKCGTSLLHGKGLVLSPMSSSVDAGAMDVETVSQSSTAGAEDVDMMNVQPEVAAGGGGGGGSAGDGSSSSSVPLPPVADAAAAGVVAGNAVVAGDASAPEEKAEPSIPEVALVPLPPNFGESKLICCCCVYREQKKDRWIEWWGCRVGGMEEVRHVLKWNRR